MKVKSILLVQKSLWVLLLVFVATLGTGSKS